MELSKIKINLFAIVFYAVAGFLCVTGRVSAWVVLLIILGQVEFNITLKE